MTTTDSIQSIVLTNQSCYTPCSKLEDKTVSLPLITTTVHQATSSSAKKFSFNESNTIRQIRFDSLSDWPHASPSRAMMAANGWFSCHVDDRVICIYCNKLCHEWTRHDHPAKVHARLSPYCPIVMSMSTIQDSPTVINNTLPEKFEPYHTSMVELSRREATFSNETWTQTLPKVDDLVRAGFYYTGKENIVTCFYCNGSLHKWSSNDNPIVEHARWFPECLYAKHLCGEESHEKIQISKKRLATANKTDKTQLARLISARLDLPVAKRLRSQYTLAVIKRCFEDQWNINHDDFTSDMHLTMACMILKKQIDIIQGCKENIIIPSKSEQSEHKSIVPKQALGECVICLTEERQLACMPCGHLCACVPCGYALRSCPVCRQRIQSFMRINS